MARNLVFTFKSADSTFRFSKLERARLYGARKRIVMDREGEPCQRAELTDDGAIVLQQGMMAQGYFDDEGTWFPNNQLVGLEPDGSPAPVFPSTIGVPQPLQGPVPAESVLDARIQSVYMLDPEEMSDALAASLADGDIYQFPYSYRTDHRSQIGFLLSNDDGVFALIGDWAAPAWCELEAPIGDFDSDDDALDDDLDFEMF